MPVVDNAKRDDKQVKARQDELFWKRVAADLLGKLRDRDAVDPLLRSALTGTGGDVYALIAIGPPALERAGKLLLDPRDPLRALKNSAGEPIEERDILQRLDLLFASSGSADVTDALLQYGAQSHEPCLVASIIARLPKNPAAVDFFKHAYLRSLPCRAEETLGSGDPALLAWEQDQNKAFRLDGRYLLGAALAMGQIGDSKAVSSAMSDVSTHGGPDDIATMQDYLAQAKRCELDAACYVKLAHAEVRARDKHSFNLLSKTMAMIIRAQDRAAADAFVADGALRTALFGGLSGQLLNLASPAVVRPLESQPYLGEQLRLKREMAGTTGLWKTLLAPGAELVAANPRFNVTLPKGECDLRKADWKNGRYAHDVHDPAIQLKDGAAGDDSLGGVNYGDMDGDGKVEAIVELANRPTYTGGGGKYTIGSDTSLLFASRGCQARFIGVLPGGTPTFKGDHLAVAGVANFKFRLLGGQLAALDATAQTSRPTTACSNQCTFNAGCDALSNSGVYGNCCDSIAGPKFAAECRRRRGE